MNEILAGVFHWKAKHPEIGQKVSSYYFPDEAVALDPLIPEQGLAWFAERKPREIILTNRLHLRHSAEFREAFGCRIWAHEAGIEQGLELEGACPFGFDYELPGSIQVLEVGALCSEETALLVPKSGGLLAFADSVIRRPDGALAFVPDEYMADTPEAVEQVKKQLCEALVKIVSEENFEHLLFAHGDPLIGDGQSTLRRFLKEQETR